MGRLRGKPTLAAPSLRGQRDFMLLWSGQLVSEFGSQVSLVAFPLLVLSLTGSPAQAGIVGLAKAAPIALALPFGALVDRTNRKRLMITCDVVRAMALAVLCIGLVSGTVPFGLVVVVAFIDGAGFLICDVAERGALRHLVPPELLGEAVARNESRTYAAMLLGPPLGGMLFGMGRVIPFVVDVISYTASTSALVLIKTRFEDVRNQSSRTRLAAGLAWIWRRPFFRTCSLLFAAGNPLLTGLTLLIVVLAKDNGASDFLVGVMLGIVAAGGFVGALVAPTLRRRLPPYWGLLGQPCLIALVLPLLFVTRDPILLGLIVAAAEALTPWNVAIVVGYRVALVPDSLQGRVQAASTLIAFSASYLGPLFVGIMLEAAGSRATILALVVWGALLASAAILAPALRRPPSEEPA